MFSGNKKTKGKQKKKGKNQQKEKVEYDQQKFDVDIKDSEPPKDMFETDANGAPYGETERALLRLHQNLIDFYSKHNPTNVNEEVLTILMQFFIDAGGVALNKKLMNKYGEDLQTFKRVADLQLPPLPADVNDMNRTSATISRMKRASVNKDLEQMGIDAPPPPSVEVNMSDHAVSNSKSSKSVQSTTSDAFAYNPKKRKKKKPKEVQNYHNQKNQENVDIDVEVEDILADLDEPPKEDPSLQLFLLDSPKKELSARDKIEAFYSMHDETKLDNEKSMDKFVAWVNDNSLEALSKKLKDKYGYGIEDYTKLARRRSNLENLLREFYLRHDRPKLETRWTILKILSWTMSNGVAALNKKFETRYGHPVVKSASSMDNELDI